MSSGQHFASVVCAHGDTVDGAQVWRQLHCRALSCIPKSWHNRADYYYTVAEVTQDVLSKSSHLGAGFLKNDLKQVQGLTSESTQY